MPLPPAHAPPPLSGSRSPFSPTSFCLFSPFPFVEPSSLASPLPPLGLPAHARAPHLLAFSNRFLSLPFCRTVFLGFLSAGLSSLPLDRHRPNNRTWCYRQSGAIHKPINSGNKLDRRATYPDPRLSPRTRRWILLATFFDLTRPCSTQQIGLSHRKLSPYLVR